MIKGLLRDIEQVRKIMSDCQDSVIDLFGRIYVLEHLGSRKENYETVKDKDKEVQESLETVLRHIEEIERDYKLSSDFA